MSKEPTNRYFDEVAIGLGSGGVSRREALKWLGAALLGGALAFAPKVAEAAPGAWCYRRSAVSTVCVTHSKGSESDKDARAQCEQLLAAEQTAISKRCKRQNALK